MGRVSKAAKLALDEFSSETLKKLSDACMAAAKDKIVGTVLAPLALHGFLRDVSDGLADGPQLTITVDAMGAKFRPLLERLKKSDIQNSDRFNHDINDFLNL